MSDRYTELSNQLVNSHIALQVVDLQGKSANLMVHKEVTVRELREELFMKFVPETGKRSQYVLEYRGKVLDLDAKMDGIERNATIYFKTAKEGEFKRIKLILSEVNDLKFFKLEEFPAVIGRSDAPNARLDVNLAGLPDYMNVSREHARITAHDDQVFIVRLREDRKNLFVNEKLVDVEQSTRLQNGDIIRLASVQLRVAIHIEQPRPQTEIQNH